MIRFNVGPEDENAQTTLLSEIIDLSRAVSNDPFGPFNCFQFGLHGAEAALHSD